MNIAVVIPCRNEVLYIEDTIHAIYNSNLPDDINIEVFVVDGMSDDGTREIIKEFISLFAMKGFITFIV